MLMIVVGAGASYDSVDLALNPHMDVSAADYRPPLAAQLFESRRSFSSAIDRYPEMRPLVSRLRYAIADGGQLEAALREVEAEANNYPERKRQLLAVQCYIRTIIGDCGVKWASVASGVTHYEHLVDEVEYWRTVHCPGSPVYWVNFNYDTMLDNAISRVYGADFSSMQSYCSRMDFHLYKPHGSVDWGHPTSLPAGRTDVMLPPPGARPLLEHFGSYTIDADSYQYMVEHDTWAMSGQTVAPAIAIPVAGKAAFELPEHHLRSLTKAVLSTSTLITIGWRGVEQHFLDLWTKRTGPLEVYCVSGAEDKSRETINNIGTAILCSSDRMSHAFDGGFGDFLRAKALRSFLDSCTKRGLLP